MALNLDNVQFTSTLPSFRNKDSGSSLVVIAGTVGSGATVTWTGTATFTRPSRMTRYSMQQNTVPAVAPYTSTDRVPLSILVGGSSFSPYITCSVAGSPGVTEIAPNIYVTATTSGFTCTVSVTNPYGGTMTLTTTTMTIYYTSFEVFGE